MVTDKKGKERKRYRYEDMMTPYEKFCSVQRPSQYLKKGSTLKQLDAFTKEMNDNEAAKQLNSAKNQLFKQLHERLKLGGLIMSYYHSLQAHFWIGIYLGDLFSNR